MSEPLFRRPTPADAETTLALMSRCEVAEYGESDSDLEDLTYDWGRIDLARDAWLAYGVDDELVGYAAVIGSGDDLHMDFYAHPRWPDPGLAAVLLDRCLARGREIVAELGYNSTARTYVAHSNHRDLETVARAGFSPGSFVSQMAITLDQPPPAARWPAGVSMRTAVPGQDDRPLHSLIQAAFDYPGRKPQPFEDWRAFMMRPDIFEPELWLLALDGEQIIGACLAFAYPSTGWVRQLGVTESWRGRGVGAALLRESFAIFYAREFERVGLTVESKRPDAYAFYQRVGMDQVRQYDEFLKLICSG